MSLLLVPALYYALFTVLAYLVSLTSLSVTRTVFVVLHSITITIACVLFYPSFVKYFRSIRLALSLPNVTIRIIRAFIVLLPSLILLILLYTGLSGSLTPPHNHDAGNHFFLIRRIFESHSLNYATIYAGYSMPFWYPLGFHWFLASLLSLVGTTNLLKYVFPSVWVITAFYPLSVFYFSRSFVASSKSSIPSIAAFFSLTWLMFPYNTFSWGGWPLILGLILLWFTLGLFTSIVRSPNSLKLVSCSLLLVSIFLTHPSEVFSFILLSIPILIFQRRQLSRLRPYKRFIALLILCNVLLLLPTLHASSTLLQVLVTLPIPFTTRTLSEYLTLLSDFHFTFNQNYVAVLFALIGFIFLLKKHYLSPVTSSLVLLFSLLSLVVLTPLLKPLYLRTFPWLESERIYYLALPYLSICAAYGLLVIIRFISRKFSHKYYRLLFIGLIVIPLLYFSLKTLGYNRYKLVVAKTENAPADARDLRLLQRNRDICHLYLNNPSSDASRFIPYLTGNKVIFDGPYKNLPDYSDRLLLLTAATHASLAAQLQTLHQKYPFDCIYSGAYTVFDTPPEMLPPLLYSHPQWAILDQEEGSVIFTFKDRLPHTTSLPTLPFIIPATDSTILKYSVTGDIGGLETSADGIPLRRVNSYLSVYTQLPADKLVITGLSAHPQPQTCYVTVDGQSYPTITFTPVGQDYHLNNLQLKPGQHSIDLTCPPAVPNQAAFAFSRIVLE